MGETVFRCEWKPQRQCGPSVWLSPLRTMYFSPITNVFELPSVMSL
jgi:hypothetical protein